MFTTPDNVLSWTGIEVSLDQVRQAQFVVESFIGRTEAEIDNAYDLTLLARAVTWQAVYMRENAEVVWEQIATKQNGQNESLATFDTEHLAPYMHRMAVQACSKLSWMGSRSVRVGPAKEGPRAVRWERD